MRQPVLMLLGILAVCGIAHAGVENVEKTLEIDDVITPGGSFHVENLLGSVTVEGGGPAGKATVRARVVAEAETQEAATALADTIRLDRQEDGNAARVHVAFPVDRHPSFRPPKSEGGGLVSRWIGKVLRRDPVNAQYAGRSVTLGPTKGATSMAVHVTVTVPHDVQVGVRQVMGAVHCVRLRGGLDVDAVTGEVIIERIYGAVHARTGDGDLAILTAKGRAVEAHSGTGDLQLVDVNADVVKVGTDDGTIEGKKLGAKALTIEVLNGKVSLDELDARKFTIDTGSGDIDLGLQLQRAREGSIRSGSGDVTLRVGTFAPFDLLVASTAGSIKSKNLPLETVAGEAGTRHLRRGTGGAEIRVTTGGGGVILREQ